MRATASSLLIAISLCLSATIPTSAQQQKEWTWKDGEGKVRPRADLDEILKQHKLWVDSNKKSGARADLHEADLTGADLYGADLSDADLYGADFSEGDLIGADLSEANLIKANLSDARLSRAYLSRGLLNGADLSGAYLSQVDLSGAALGFANLSGALLIQADLSRADLSEADLSGADLSEAHLIQAILIAVDLSHALMFDTDLSDALLYGADLSSVVFEPKDLPSSESIASADNLELMTYNDNPGPLTKLRKRLQDDGFREQERAITCALNRHDADPSKLRSSVEEKWRSVRGRPFDKNKIMPLRSFVEGTFKLIAFDLTCEYGLSYGRPLRIVGLLWLLFSIVYAVFMHRPGKSGVYFVGTRLWRGKSNTQAIQIRPRSIPAAKWWKLPFLWLRREWRVLRASMFFSLMSAFNIGFRDINFGRWLRLLTKREYDLKAVGWARTVSGFQSLLSVYLIALWVLSYFGRPFG